MNNDNKGIFSILGLVIAIASLFAGTKGIFAILGLVFSILGIKKSDDNITLRRIGIAGLVISIIGFILWLAITILGITMMNSIYIH